MFPRYPPNLGDGVFAGVLSDACATRELLKEAGVAVPSRGFPAYSGFVSLWGQTAFFTTRCLLCFSLLKFWAFLTSGNHTKPQRETQLKPPGFTCFHNKTRRGAEFALERFGDL